MSESGKDNKLPRNNSKETQKRTTNKCSARDQPEKKDSLTKARQPAPLATSGAGKSSQRENKISYVSILQKLQRANINIYRQFLADDKKEEISEEEKHRLFQIKEVLSLFNNDLPPEALHFLEKNDTASSPSEMQQKRIQLEERFTLNDAENITGIVNLSGLCLTDLDIPMIVHRAFLLDKEKCTGIILRDNDLTSNGIKMFVDALLLLKPQIRYLSLSNNPNVGDAGVEHIVRLLKDIKCMTFLALPQTGITDHGVRLLADAICNSDEHSSESQLKTLHISHNKSITDDSFESILKLIVHTQNLSTFAIEECGLSEKSRKKLRKVIDSLTTKKFVLTN